MSITYGSQTGTDINSRLVAQTIGTQTGGDNQIQLSSTTAVPSGATGYGGNVGSGANGLGDTYAGRRAVLRPGTATEEQRRITAASGSGPTLITLNRDWDSNPVSGDVAHIPYEFGDIEDGGAGGGIQLNTKTGLWELSNALNIKSTGSLEFLAGHALEGDDRGTNTNIVVESGGRFYGGFPGGGGAYVDGGVNTNYNGAAGEPSWQMQGGSRVDFYDMLFWAQLTTQQFENANGSDGRYYRCKFLNLTDELHLFDSLVRDCSAVGKGGTAEIVRVDAGVDCDGLVLSNIDTIETASGDTTTETIELSGVTFLSVTDLITLVNNKTYNMIDTVWPATLYSDFNDAAVTGTAAINDGRSVKATVKKSDGTLLQDALVNIYENTLDDLVLELVTDSNGYAEDFFVHRAHAWITGAGSTTTRSGHARQAGKWLYLPLIFSQNSALNFNGTITLSPDNNIVQTTQATAKSAGSGITWNQETNPSSVVDYTGGSGSPVLAVGDTVTGSLSGASGIVTEFKDGDQAAGTIHLKTRNASNFVTSDVLQRSGGGWTANFTSLSEQYFSIWIDGNDLAYQTIYDYLAAIQNETTLTADGEKIWEWCRSAQTQPLYSTGSSFYTEQSNFKGIIIIDGGAGTVDYFTGDDEGTWVPPATVTLQTTVTNQFGTGVSGVKVRYQESDGTLIANGTTNGSGIFSYGIDAGLLPYNNAKVIVRDKRFEDPPDTILNITTAGFNLIIGLQPDTDINLP